MCQLSCIFSHVAILKVRYVWSGLGQRANELLLLLLPPPLIQIAGGVAFAFSCAICVATLGLYVLMERTDFFRFHMNLDAAKAAAAEAEEEEGKAEGEGKGEEKGGGGRKRAKDKRFRLTGAFLLEMASRSWLFFVAIAAVGLVTASTYPALTSLVEPASPDDSDWHQVYFTQASYG